MWHIVHKETGKQLRINNTTSKGYYQSRASIIRALKTSGILSELGLVWGDLAIVDHWGRTFEERCSVPVVEGAYALRHKEGWYFMTHYGGKVWYKTVQSVECSWKIAEIELKQMENRDMYKDPGCEGYQLVRGRADGSVEVFPCRY